MAYCSLADRGLGVVVDDYEDYRTAIPQIQFFLEASERLFKAAVLFTCMVPLGVGAAAFVGETFWLGFIIPLTVIFVAAAIACWSKWSYFTLTFTINTLYSPTKYTYMGAKGLLKAYEAYRDEQFLRDAGL